MVFDPWGQACQKHCSHLSDVTGSWLQHDVHDETGKVIGIHLFHEACFKELSRENGGYCPRCPTGKGKIWYESFLKENEAQEFIGQVAGYPIEKKSYVERQRAAVLNGLKKLSYLSIPIIAFANHCGRERIWTSAVVPALVSGFLGYSLTKSETNEEKRLTKYEIAFRHGASLPMASARNAMIIAGVASILSNLWYPHSPKFLHLMRGYVH